MRSTWASFCFINLVGWIVKWFFIVVILIAVTDFLGWTQVTDFLSEVALYIPNVIIAVVILTVGLVMGQFVHNVVEKSIKVSGAPTPAYKPLAALSKWAIIICATRRFGTTWRSNCFNPNPFHWPSRDARDCWWFSFGLGGKKKPVNGLIRLKKRFPAEINSTKNKKHPTFLAQRILGCFVFDKIA